MEFGRLGFKPDRFVIVGWIRKKNELLNSHRKPSIATNTFGVMLNGENGKNSNVSMIKAANVIAEKLSMKYLIRLHPMNDPDEYKNIISARCVSVCRFDADEYINQIDFSIAHMSGTAIEMLTSGSPVYLLDDGRLAEVFRKTGLSYLDVESMIDAIKIDKEALPRELKRWVYLGRWYNDDYNQFEKIQRVILNEEI
jgi:hypothetical protein